MVANSIIDIIDVDDEVENVAVAVDRGYDFISYIQTNRSDIQYGEEHERIKKIIELEQPIHFEELCRRAAPIYGNQKATIKIRTQIEYQFESNLLSDIDRKGDFITLIGFDELRVRIPNEADGYIRNIAHISPDELALAMITIANHSCGITSEDLFIVTAREFGFKRTSDNISTILRTVYAQMLNEGKVREVDGKVNVINDQFK